MYERAKPADKNSLCWLIQPVRPSAVYTSHVVWLLLIEDDCLCKHFYPHEWKQAFHSHRSLATVQSDTLNHKGYIRKKIHRFIIHHPSSFVWAPERKKGFVLNVIRKNTESLPASLFTKMTIWQYKFLFCPQGAMWRGISKTSASKGGKSNSLTPKQTPGEPAATPHEYFSHFGFHFYPSG